MIPMNNDETLEMLALKADLAEHIAEDNDKLVETLYQSDCLMYEISVKGTPYKIYMLDTTREFPLSKDHYEKLVNESYAEIGDDFVHTPGYKC